MKLISKLASAWLRFARRPRRHARALAGYTVAEVVVAVLVLTTISTAYYAALSYGFQVVRSSREDLRATQILMQRTEAIRLCRWTQLTNTITFTERYDPLGATNNTAGTIYVGTISTNAPPSIPDSVSYKKNIRLVTVTVYWTNYNGKIPVFHSRQMQTEVARYGLQPYLWGAMP